MSWISKVKELVGWKQIKEDWKESQRKEVWCARCSPVAEIKRKTAKRWAVRIAVVFILYWFVKIVT